MSSRPSILGPRRGATPEPARAAPLEVAVRDLVVAYDGEPVLRHVDVEVGAGEHLVLLGPSGCGKTTLLRAVSGLVRPLEGTVSLGGVEVSGPRRLVPPERRRVGMVFQDGALFPHLTVAANVGYGLPRAERHGQRVEEMLDLVGLGGLGDRLPTTLSGGQAQRVALARALAPGPRVLLLDEPFSSLDASLRAQIRSDVRRLLVEVGVTAIYVTHDQDEAFVLGDRVVVMSDGQVRQVGSPAELYESPADPWVAAFVGESNLLDGVARGRVADTAVGAVRLAADTVGPVTVLARPEDLVTDRPGDGRVEVVEYHGHDTRLEVRLPGGPVVAVRQPGPPRHHPGDGVTVTFAGRPALAWPASP